MGDSTQANVFANVDNKYEFNNNNIATTVVNHVNTKLGGHERKNSIENIENKYSSLNRFDNWGAGNNSKLESNYSSSSNLNGSNARGKSPFNQKGLYDSNHSKS